MNCMTSCPNPIYHMSPDRAGTQNHETRQQHETNPTRLSTGKERTSRDPRPPPREKADELNSMASHAPSRHTVGTQRTVTHLGSTTPLRPRSRNLPRCCIPSASLHHPQHSDTTTSAAPVCTTSTQRNAHERSSHVFIDHNIKQSSSPATQLPQQNSPRGAAHAVGGLSMHLPQLAGYRLTRAQHLCCTRGSTKPLFDTTSMRKVSIATDNRKHVMTGLDWRAVFHQWQGSVAMGVFAIVLQACTAVAQAAEEAVGVVGPVEVGKYVPSPVDMGWQIYFGSGIAVVPFIIGSYEFGKRILIQRRCASAAVLIFQPTHWIVHPENYLILLSKKHLFWIKVSRK